MAFIETVPVNRATGDVRAMYESNQANFGYVPNFAKVFSHRPKVNAAWAGLLGSVRSNLDARRYELITLAAARALRSSYCMLAHGTVLRQQFCSAEQLAAIAANFSAADLAPVDVAIMSFAEHIVRDSASVTAEEIQGLREHGLTDTEIFDVAAATAVRCFFSKLLDALGAEPDSTYADLERELRQQLTVGRAISQAVVERVTAAAP
ncbi:MAG TPA: peroxidase-related enzyme [Burkholderiales bacterium]|nr:peroxidase-related enzyme [Burkholderiales bacterium]